MHRFLTAQRIAVRAKFDSTLRRLAGEVQGIPFVAVRQSESDTLRTWMSKNTRPTFETGEVIALSLIDALAELHLARFVHGALRSDTIHVSDDKAYFGELATDRLDTRPEASSFSADVFSLGELLFELFAGVTPLRAEGKSLREMAACSVGVSDLVGLMLSANADKRPASAVRVLELWKTMGGSDRSRANGDVDVVTALAAFDASPSSKEAAITLEQAAHDGDRAQEITGRFEAAAAASSSADTKRDLLSRAARLAIYVSRNDGDAERVLRSMLVLDASDAFASEALEELLRRTHRHEELVEGILARTENATSARDKSRAFADLGRVFSRDLGDREQAIVALAQAVCADPSDAGHIAELERLCAGNKTAWEEVLASCMETLKAGALSAGERVDLLMFTGNGYDRYVARSDMAVLAYDQVLATDPAHEGAHHRRVAIFRRGSQWSDLAMALEGQANATSAGAKSSAARMQAADVVAMHLGDLSRAEALLARASEEDPKNAAAFAKLAAIVEKSGDADKWLSVLERQAAASNDKSSAGVWARAGKVWEEKRQNLEEALVRYARALLVDPRCLEALQGQERIWTLQGNLKEIVGNLRMQAELSATPRQHVAALERIAKIQDEEFFDHVGASETLESILERDPKNPTALSNLARHQRTLKQFDREVATLDTHIQSVAGADQIGLLLRKARALASELGSPEKAMKVYEEVLAVDGHHTEALEALASLRETSGDVHAALSSIEKLAEQATTSETRSEQWTRAAKFLESRGDKDAAVERYKRALSEQPENTIASAGLRAAYEASGDHGNVVSILEHDLKLASGELARARLYSELARVHYAMGAKDSSERAVGLALELDSTNLLALLVAGDLAFDAHRFREAIVRFEAVLGRVNALSSADGKRVLVRYIEAYGRANAPSAPAPSSHGPASLADLSSLAPPSMTTLIPVGETHPKLRAAVDMLWNITGDDRQSLAAASLVLFDHAEPQVSLDAHRKLIEGDALRGVERAHALYRTGESARRVEALEEAETLLREASKLAPTFNPTWKALGRLYNETGKFEDAAACIRRRVETSSKAERFDALIDLADVTFLRLGNKSAAQEIYGQALQERPGDRRLLAKLMQIHTEGKDWGNLLGVVQSLAMGVEDTAQRAKYNHTAAAIAFKHLHDNARAKELYASVLNDDPHNTKAAEEYLRLLDEVGDADTSEQVLNTLLDVAQEKGDANRARVLLDRVAALYDTQLNEPALAIDAYEAAQALDPDSRERADKLAVLYTKNPAEYLNKAEDSQAAMLRHNPYRVESYKLLRQMYTDVRAADPAWCMCQALSSLKLAEPDEERFYLKHKKTSPAAAKAVMLKSDRASLIHEDADATLTALFALLRPSIESMRAKSLAEHGFEAAALKDAASDGSLLGQTTNYAAGVFALPALPIAAAPGAVKFVAAQPGILAGTCASTGNPEEAQVAAFHVARALWLAQGGYAVRTLVPSATGLKAWVYASIRFVLPSFAMPEELQSTAAECTEVLKRDMVGHAKDELIALISKLRAVASIDLGRWTNGVDLTADRAGLILCNDLPIALAELRRSGGAESTLSTKERSKELVLYAVSRPYFQIRNALKVGIES